MLLCDGRQEGAKGEWWWVWGARGRVQSMMQPEMKWIIECGINTANSLGSPPFQKERKTRENGARGRGGRDVEREKG